ncbi:MAG: ribonuclease E/G [Bacteroidetes bacterium]|nr:MAG: ribonuclease E/G [Bacteroidota bacterium]RLD80966.1 MAG: ribonuclease E/G [Bacteroidota bacterium]
MEKELIINSFNNEVEIALLEDKFLVELHKEKVDNNYAVGDVYLGRVRKIMPGLNAAFIDVGYEKDGFLHYLDLGPQVRSLNKFVRYAISTKGPQPDITNFKLEQDIEKTGKISAVLKTNQQIAVQIAKEPISTKGPRISSEISFAGRYLVLVPFSNRISISQKIKSVEERNRLKRLIQSIKPNNMGVIIRTVAEDILVADLDADLKSLVKKWYTLTHKLRGLKPPNKIVSELDRTSALLRDVLNESFNSVHVNDHELYEEIRHFIGKIAPQKVDIVKHFKGRGPIFENFGVDKQIKGSFGKTVTIKSGVYLVIEHTEALHVIDVNSGHRVNKLNSQETNALEVNLEAASEIARQLRLRDMGGIIVVDFIDLLEAKHRRQLFQHLKEQMSKDRAKHTILPPSKFGLVQITRQRVRPEMTIETLEKCPSCNGTGKVGPSILITDEIENNIQYLVQEQNEKQITLEVHPFLHAFMTKGMLSSLRNKWQRKFGKKISINKNSNFHLLEYHLYDRNGEELKI